VDVLGASDSSVAGLAPIVITVGGILVQVRQGGRRRVRGQASFSNLKKEKVEKRVDIYFETKWF